MQQHHSRQASSDSSFFPLHHQPHYSSKFSDGIDPQSMAPLTPPSVYPPSLQRSSSITNNTSLSTSSPPLVQQQTMPIKPHHLRDPQIPNISRLPSTTSSTYSLPDPTTFPVPPEYRMTSGSVISSSETSASSSAGVGRRRSRNGSTTRDSAGGGGSVRDSGAFSDFMGRYSTYDAGNKDFLEEEGDGSYEGGKRRSRFSPEEYLNEDSPSMLPYSSSSSRRPSLTTATGSEVRSRSNTNASSVSSSSHRHNRSLPGTDPHNEQYPSHIPSADKPSTTVTPIESSQSSGLGSRKGSRSGRSSSGASAMPQPASNTSTTRTNYISSNNSASASRSDSVGLGISSTFASASSMTQPVVRRNSSFQRATSTASSSSHRHGTTDLLRNGVLGGYESSDASSSYGVGMQGDYSDYGDSDFQGEEGDEGDSWDNARGGDSGVENWSYTEEDVQEEGVAVTLAEDGRGLIIDNNSLDLEKGLISSNMTNATHLLLSHSPSPALLPQFLRALLPRLTSTLVVLDLSSCSLLSFPEDVINLHTLEELNISQNPILHLPIFISRLTSLRLLQADEIGCNSLPPSMALLRNLHTICLRGNRLLSLPGWLCQLPCLETLLVEGNPFAGPWKTLTDPLCQLPPTPPPAPSLFSGRDSTFTTTSSVPSPMVHGDILAPVGSTSFDSFYLGAASNSRNTGHTSSPNMSRTNSNSNSVEVVIPSSDSRAVPQIDQIGSSLSGSVSRPPMRFRSNTMSSKEGIFSSKGDLPELPSADEERGDGREQVRRMRSVGTLGALSKFTRALSPPTNEDLPVMSTSANKFGIGMGPPPLKKGYSLGRRSGSKVMNADHSRTPSNTSFEGIEELDGDSEADLNSSGGSRGASIPGTPDTGRNSSLGNNKKDKWGFLRKMSMGRMRSPSGSGNGFSRPQPVHSNTEPIIEVKLNNASLGVRSKTATSFNDGTVTGNLSSVFGDARPASSATTMTAMDLRASSATAMENNGQIPSPSSYSSGQQHLGIFPSNRKGKRRSFLPVLSSPPSLDIPIPSTSPFLGSASVFTGKPDSDYQEELQPNAISVFETIRARQKSNPSPVTPSQSAMSEEERQAAYNRALGSLMNYLRDMYDLSQPSLVTQLQEGSPLPDLRPTSPPPMSSNVSSSGHQRIRRGTGEMHREYSESSVVSSDVSEVRAVSSAGTSHTSNSDDYRETEVRKYKDDKVKRAMVIKEIINTERTYVKLLRDLIELYVKPAEAPVGGLNNKETIVPFSERKIVFNGLAGLLAFHRESFLPQLEKAAMVIFRGDPDPDGELSRRAAKDIGDVFRTYNPFMKMYSTYINDFDFVLQRLRSWSSSSSPSTPSLTSPAASSLHLATMGLTLQGPSPPLSPDSGALTAAQKKRVKQFLKRARAHPKHTQLNLEAYLLLPVQRVPRYRLLLEDLLKATPPLPDQPYDTLEDAFEEISALASSMNEEKRDAESRHRLVQWQARIRGKFPSPLVQPHRKLIKDGPLTLIRIVKKTTEYVEISIPVFDDGDNTITRNGSLVPFECLAPPEVSVTQLLVVLCSDIMVLCRKDPTAKPDDPAPFVDLHAVCRMQSKTEPASVISGSVLRVVDTKMILYLEAPSPAAAASWAEALNISFQMAR